MKYSQLIFEEYLEEFLPIIVQNYSISEVYVIGFQTPQISFLKIHLININPNNFTNPILLSSAIIKEIVNNGYLENNQLQVGIIGNNPIQILSMYLVAQSLNSNSYMIINQQITILPP